MLSHAYLLFNIYVCVMQLSGRGPVKLKDKHRQILKEVKRGERTNNPFEYN